MLERESVQPLQDLSHSSEDWWRERDARVTASEAGVLLGWSKYETPKQMWERKKGLVPREPTSAAAHRGNVLEEPVAQLWQDLSGERLTGAQTLVISPCGRVAATLDYVDGFGCPVDIKTSVAGWSKTWVAQLHVQMFCTGTTSARIVRLGPDLLPTDHVVLWDQGLWDVLIGRVDEFLALLALDEWPESAPMHGADYLALPAIPRKMTVMVTPHDWDVLAEWRAAVAERKEAEGREQEAKEALMRLIGTSEGLVDEDGTMLVSWKNDRPKRQLDKERLLRDFPEVAEACMIERPGSRRLLNKERKGRT